MSVTSRAAFAGAVAVSCAVAAVAAGAAATSIIWVAETDLPAYIGQPWKPFPLPPVRPPQNPSMAANPFNNVHNDTWMSDTYDIPGPLGRQPFTITSTLAPARRSLDTPSFVCGTLTFDSRGRIITPCYGPGEASLVLLDPASLEVLAYRQLPLAADATAAYGSAYMYLDDQDRAIVTQTNKLQVFSVTEESGQAEFAPGPEYDLTDYVGASDAIQSVIPDWGGRLWFVVRKAGTVGVLDPATGAVGYLTLNEEIANSFAVNGNDAYIVTTQAMYRLTAGADGVPRQVWRAPNYKNLNIKKDGQLSPGSGTTPTLLDNGRYVAIADNDSQMHVVVYRTAEPLQPNEERLVCETAVFPPGAGATEDSLIGVGRSLIVANEYGYTVDLAAGPVPQSTPTVPGVARVDIDANGKGCRVVWSNDSVAAPQVAPKMSTKNGLIYLFTRKYDPATLRDDGSNLDVWYWTAMDFRTGAVVWETLVGTGGRFDSWVPGPALGPDETLYVGAYGGMVATRDAELARRTAVVGR